MLCGSSSLQELMEVEEEKKSEDEEEEEEDSSEYEEYTDSEEETGPRLKPVFVRKQVWPTGIGTVFSNLSVRID